MTREERLIKLFDTFDKCAEKLCQDTHGAYFEIVPTYRKNRTDAQNLKYRSAYIFYNSFGVELKYTAHGAMSLTNSILECLIRLDKNKESIAIPLPLFLDYCDIGTCTPLCIPSILDDLGMCQAFDCICGALKNYFSAVENVCNSEESRQHIFTAFVNEMASLLNVTVDDDIGFYFNESLYSFLTLRLTSAHFINYIKGDIKTATKQLNKVKDKLGYEKRVLELLLNEKATEIPDLSSIREALKTFSKGGVQNPSSGKEFIAMFMSWIPLWLGFSAIFVGFYFLLVFLEGRSSVYLMGPIYNFPHCILFGFISAIAASYFIRFKIYKLFFPKDFERYRATDQIQNGAGADKFMRVFLAVIIICSIAGSILLAKWNLNFKEHGFADNSKFLSVSGEFYDYDEIDRIYYKPNRINDLGETLDFPSYVIVLKNGREIDLYAHDETEHYEDWLLDFFNEKGVYIDMSQKQ